MSVRARLRRRERRQIGGAVLLSLLAHGFALTLHFKGPGPGLPPLQWPWKERQSPVQDLKVFVEPAKRPPVSATAATAKIARNATRKNVAKHPPRPGPGAKSPVSRAQPRAPEATAPASPPTPKAQSASPVTPAALPELAIQDVAPVPAAAAAEARLIPLPEVRKAPVDTPPPPPILAKKIPDREKFVVPKSEIAEITAQAPSPQPDALAQLAEARAQELETRTNAEGVARAQARRQAQEAEARAREQEARRKADELARENASRLAQVAEAAAREQDAQRKAQEDARAEAQARENARQVAMLAERESAEAAARQAAQRAAENAAAARQGEREREAADARSTRSASAPSSDSESAGVRARISDANRNPAGRAPTGQADARVVDRPAIRLPVAPPDNRCRRAAGTWNRPNLPMATYAATWRHGIRQSAPFELLQGAKTGPYENPVVTVAVRSDGTIESVNFNRSSGIAQVDEAVRQIIETLAPYRPFPSELEMDCDVIEIPSIWSFDRALRLTWRGQ